MVIQYIMINSTGSQVPLDIREMVNQTKSKEFIWRTIVLLLPENGLPGEQLVLLLPENGLPGEQLVVLFS